MADETRDKLRLETILRVVADLDRRLATMAFERFVDDGDECDLTAFRLSVIGENANKLSASLRSRHPHIPWREMYAFRNLVSHEYMMIVPRFVWAATQELGPLQAMCTMELKRFPARQDTSE